MIAPVQGATGKGYGKNVTNLYENTFTSWNASNRVFSRCSAGFAYLHGALNIARGQMLRLKDARCTVWQPCIQREEAI